MFKPTPESDAKFRDMVQRLADQPPDGWTNPYFIYNCTVKDAADLLDDWQVELLDKKLMKHWRAYAIGFAGMPGTGMREFSKFIDKPIYSFRKTVKKYQKKEKLIPIYIGEYFDFDSSSTKPKNMPQLVFVEFPKCIHRR